MKELVQVLARLQAEGLITSYAIGGGFAALAYTEPFLTEDIDVFCPMKVTSLLVDPTPILNRVKELGFTEMQEDRIVIGSWPVQFLPPAGALEEEALEATREIEMDGLKVRVLSPEHLVAIATALGRPKDIVRVGQLMASGQVDRGLLREILERHGITEIDGEEPCSR